jgi:hypothetical protein
LKHAIRIAVTGAKRLWAIVTPSDFAAVAMTFAPTGAAARSRHVRMMRTVALRALRLERHGDVVVVAARSDFQHVSMFTDMRPRGAFE